MVAPSVSHRLSFPNPNGHSAQPSSSSSSSSSSSAMIATLPPVDFGFDALKDRMAAFTLRFDEFIECGRKRILEEKNEFAKSMAEDKDRQHHYTIEVQKLKRKEADILKRVEREDLEAESSRQAIVDVEKRRQSKEEHGEYLRAQIEEVQQAIQKKREMRVKERQALSSQQGKNQPEQVFWEDQILSMRIEGAGMADHLKITYTRLVDNDWNKEFWFVVGFIKDYEVTMCRPKLPEPEVTRALDKVNETSNFKGFLKDMRSLFKRHIDGDFDH